VDNDALLQLDVLLDAGAKYLEDARFLRARLRQRCLGSKAGHHKHKERNPPEQAGKINLPAGVTRARKNIPSPSYRVETTLGRKSKGSSFPTSFPSSSVQIGGQSWMFETHLDPEAYARRLRITVNLQDALLHARIRGSRKLLRASPAGRLQAACYRAPSGTPSAGAEAAPLTATTRRIVPESTVRPVREIVWK
jgi:hypothetical protein